MHIALNYKTDKYHKIFSFKIPYVTVLHAESMFVLFSVLTPKQIIVCSEVDDRLQI